MRTNLFAAVLAVVLATALLAPAAHAQLKLPRVSPAATVTQTIGLTDLTVAYCRPGVKGRVIWGGLVPYDEPWRTGERGDPVHHDRPDPVRRQGARRWHLLALHHPGEGRVDRGDQL